MYIDELTIRDEIQDKLESRVTIMNGQETSLYMAKARSIAARSEREVRFDINNFSSMSLNDEIVKFDEFGLIHIVKSDYEVQPNHSRDAINEIPISIQAIIIDKGDLSD